MGKINPQGRGLSASAKGWSILKSAIWYPIVYSDVLMIKREEAMIDRSFLPILLYQQVTWLHRQKFGRT